MPVRLAIEFKANVGHFGLENLRGDAPHIQIDRSDTRQFFDPTRLNKVIAGNIGATKVEGNASIDLNVFGAEGHQRAQPRRRHLQ